MAIRWLQDRPYSTITPLLGALVAALLVGAASKLVITLYEDGQLERQRAKTIERLTTLRAQLEGEINSTLHLTRGLTAYVATHPDVTTVEFNQLAREIINHGRNIRNIGLAKDNVITHMYPLAGNEAALGLNYEETPSQWPAVKRAMDSQKTVVAGPVKLIQGGMAFIARTPIYTPTAPPDSPHYWGIASIVIDMQQLFLAAGIHANSGSIKLAMRGKDGLGEEGELIWGDEALFNENPVMLSVMLPNGSWQIAAIPEGGWGDEGSLYWLPRLIGGLLALLIGSLFGILLWTHAACRHLSLHDPLTGLPNRRLLEDRLEQMIAQSTRNAAPFGVFYIDLDDFKQINDQFGHKTGDALLIEVSRRMLASVRGTDTVARVGGDEFVVLVSAIGNDSEAQQILEKLREGLRGTTHIHGTNIEVVASIGSALYPRDGTTLDELLISSDRRMYQEKGRNRKKN